MCFLTEDHLQLCMTTSFLKFHRNAQFHKSVKSWIRLLHIHHAAYQQWQLGTCIAGLHMYYCIHWKASEWRSFLVFYSVACFKHVMPATYYSHWLLLVFSLVHLHTDKHRNATKTGSLFWKENIPLPINAGTSSGSSDFSAEFPPTTVWLAKNSLVNMPCKMSAAILLAHCVRWSAACTTDLNNCKQRQLIALS